MPDAEVVITMAAQGPGQHLCIVIHSHRPYCFDLCEILALPSGFRYRNRFDIQWIDAGLRQDIEQTVGERVLLTLRDLDSNMLIPFRWGILFNVQRVGGVVLFEYHLEDLIKYENDRNVRQQEIIARTKVFADNHAWLPGSAGQALETPSVFTTNVGLRFPSVDPNDLTAWGSCAAAVATAPCYARIEFLKIVGLFNAAGERAPVINESFIVRSKSMYELKIFQHVPEPGQDSIPAHSLVLNSFPDHITALRPKLQAVGKYDMLTFVVKVLNLAPGEQTALEIPHEPDAATTKSAVTSLYLPIRVREAGKGRLIGAVGLASLSLFFMFRPHIGHVPVDTVRNLATIAFVLTVSGPSRALAALWPSWPWGGEK